MSTAANVGGSRHLSRRREHPAQARLRAGALRSMGGFPELRDLVHDHLDPRRLPDVVLHRVPVGRPGRVTWGWLLVGGVLHHRLARHGRDRLDLSDRRRALLLGVEARQPGLGLVHRLVQPRRADRGHGGDRLRAARSSRRRCSNLLFDYPNTVRLDLRHLHLSCWRSRPDQHAPRQRHGDAEHVSAWWHMAGVLVIVAS